MMLFKVILISYSLTAALGDVILATRDGKIRGLEKLSARNHTYHAFLQIPYAQPPVGKLRFREPRPVNPWNDILDATKEQNVCYQMSSNSNMENEDCLYINVYTPVSSNRKLKNSSLPVMFYIHGGGYINGNSLYSTTGPQYLMDNGVVVVTVLYRLGPFGFLSTGDSVVPGNYGLKDQNMALRWVKRNIGCFGGDPNKVTIFGQSSGASSVGYHIISNQSKGLFRGAIQLSGSVLAPHGYQRNARGFAYTLAKFINPNFNDNATSEGLLNFLQSVTAKEIDTATEKFTQGPGSMILSEGSWFAPVIEVDNEDAFVTENMHESLEKGHFNKVPLVVGLTSEEAISQASDLELFKYSVQQFDDNLTFLIQADMHITDLKNKTRAGEDVRRIYTDGLLQDNLGAAVKYFSDAYVSKPVIRHARLQSVFTDVYFYQFSYHGLLGGNNASVEGAGRVTHSEDLRYLWVSDASQDISIIDPKDLQTVDRYVKMYTNFARTLNPTPIQESLLQNIKWPTANQECFRYLDIDEDLTIKINPKEPVYSKWVDAYNKWGIPPFDTY